ncbi:TetR/AcrR family transcriptional regulator [Naasia lichenicola]|uniref:TetR/AcrR family transcriptional regulator n=1 Tax=Naasia lichenicola TaxID=2565933 RepID=A0A4S4FE83_9MICO|nr:TetR/AcrR family transcriptional regulator [Naasia lichenicola]THG28439.1 TetR/AcrR family transcriptional regulator [Naasia lichenicola]
MVEDVETRARARPLAPDDRRDAILDAVLPLIREHGYGVSTRQIADAAGLAEGTIFRAFGDKESLINAAIARLFDPLPLLAALRSIPFDLPLEEKVAAVIVALGDRFTEIRSVMSGLGLRSRPPVADAARSQWIDVVRELFAGDEHRLAIPIDSLAHYIRLVAFSSALPPLNFAHEFSPAELADLIVFGATREGEPYFRTGTRPTQNEV